MMGTTSNGGSASVPSTRIAVDIGGTFTDVVLESERRFCSIKTLTDPREPERAFLEGVSLVLEDAAIDAGEVDLIIHGTTLATNALIERKGAKVALLCTEGFRDSVEIGYEHRFEQCDVFMQRPPPLVPRWLRYGVPERVAADGSLLSSLDESAIRALVPELRERS